MAKKYDFLMFCCSAVVAITIGLPPVQADIKQCLGGDWEVTGKLDEKDIQSPATVPGGIYSDLMAARIINDIFYGFGVRQYKEIGRSDWNYALKFIVNKELLSKNVVNLVFEGLDTFASILVNGKAVGETDNMFVRYVFNVKQYLKLGSGNKIEVRFTSAVKKAKQLEIEQNKHYELPPASQPAQFEGEPNINQIRKMQASFAWDWGPSFPSVGIWRDVYLEAFNTVSIQYVLATSKINIQNDFWMLEVTTFLNVHIAKGQIQVVLTVENGEKISASTNLSISSPQQDHRITINMAVPKEKVREWWPNGMGNQSLYELVVRYKDQNETNERTQKIGFRTVELIQGKEERGLSFYFKINGIPLFVKGANEIPLSILPEKQSDPVTIDRILQSAKETNMNMIRVWGGGVYESDYFYQRTSELGILVWQDFMFACALYPVRDDFLRSVTEEVKHQVKRLHSFPSVIVWSGNNENEGALQYGWWDMEGHYDQYRSDYVKLYHDVIQTELKQILPDAIFIYSSPTNGLQTENEGFISSSPGSPLFGDVHFYDYFSDSWETSHLPIPRFSSEYGYQSMPSLQTWLTVTGNLKDLLPNSSFLYNRQHHPGGNEENIHLIKIQLELPAETHPNFVKAFIYYSQILQAQSVKVQTEHYRSYAGRLDASGKGNTMGALYWQLNDVWVAPTWSGIDITGKWKMLQYFAKDFFAPTVISANKIGNNSIKVRATTDLVDGLKNAVVMIYIWKWNSLQPAAKINETITLDHLKTFTIRYDITSLLSKGDCGKPEEATKNCFLYFYLMSSDRITNYSPVNYLFLDKLKNSNLVNAIVKIVSVSPTGMKKTFKVTTRTNAVALFVWLDSPSISGRFSRNGYLQVHAEQSVEFYADQATTVKELRKSLTVTHLRNAKYL